jgi:hypothetical protein
MTHTETPRAPSRESDVTRHYRLPAMRHEGDAGTVREILRVLPGIRDTATDAGRHRLTLVYDATQMDDERVRNALAQAGFPAGAGAWERLKGIWFRYLDETVRENAEAAPRPCCSNPRGIPRQPR